MSVCDFFFLLKTAETRHKKAYRFFPGDPRDLTVRVWAQPLMFSQQPLLSTELPRERGRGQCTPPLWMGTKCIRYLEVTEADVLLDAQFYHVKDVEVKETTCRPPR